MSILLYLLHGTYINLNISKGKHIQGRVRRFLRKGRRLCHLCLHGAHPQVPRLQQGCRRLMMSCEAKGPRLELLA